MAFNIGFLLSRSLSQFEIALVRFVHFNKKKQSCICQFSVPFSLSVSYTSWLFGLCLTFDTIAPNKTKQLFFSVWFYNVYWHLGHMTTIRFDVVLFLLFTNKIKQLSRNSSATCQLPTRQHQSQIHMKWSHGPAECVCKQQTEQKVIGLIVDTALFSALIPIFFFYFFSCF